MGCRVNTPVSDVIDLTQEPCDNVPADVPHIKRESEDFVDLNVQQVKYSYRT